MFLENGYQEQRRTRRIKADAPVRFQAKGKEHYSNCLSRDISLGGLRVKANQFIPLETALKVEIELKNGEVIDGFGRVVWISQVPYSDWYELGLRFEEYGSELNSRERLEQFVMAKEK